MKMERRLSAQGPDPEHDLLFSWQPVKELSIGWISALRPSRQPPCPEEPPQAASRRGGFLRMRSFLNAISEVSHLRSARQGRVSKHAPRPSSQYAGASSIPSQALTVRPTTRACETRSV